MAFTRSKRLLTDNEFTSLIVKSYLYVSASC